MIKYSSSLNENIQQAKAYLRTKDINPEDDYAFQVIKDRCQGKEGYIGWLTKIAHEDIRPTANGWGTVINEIENILKKIVENPQIIELLDTPVAQQKSLEDFQDDKDSKQGTFGKDTQKVLLVWKDHPKIEKLMRIVRKHELKSGLKYKYDKDLLKYIKNVKE